MKLSAAVTYDEVEAIAGKLWICVQEHNRDKANIEVLQ